MNIQQIFAEHTQVVTQSADELIAPLERAIALTDACLSGGHQVLACGNGGSAAEAQHLVAELIGRYRDERRAMPAIALNADTAILTALSNDYGYDRVFARQVEGLARSGDLLFALSTSGNSPSVVQAAQSARAQGCTVIGLTGARGGNLAAHCDLLLRAPSTDVARVQEMHMLCIHVIVEGFDARLRERSAP